MTSAGPSAPRSPSYPRQRVSVLGTYSIDANGDTTLSSYGGNTVRGGRIVFNKVIKVQTHA